MGADYGSFAVWDWRRKRKIQSGFPDEKSARAYIAKRRMVYRGWGIVRFTKTGIETVYSPVSRPRHRLGGRKSTISARLRAEVLRRYTGAYGQQSALARELHVPVGTIQQICRTDRRRAERERVAA